MKKKLILIILLSFFYYTSFAQIKKLYKLNITKDIKVNKVKGEFFSIDEKKILEKNDIIKIGDKIIFMGDKAELTTDINNNSIVFNFENAEILDDDWYEFISFPKFPWTPPIPSTIKVLDKNTFKQFTKYSDVNMFLCNGLERCGFTEKRYYFVPGGFALVTRMEYIKEDGSIIDTINRWGMNIINNYELDFLNFFRSLFIANTGYFRLSVFIITNKDLSTNPTSIEMQQARNWIYNGVAELPKETAKQRFDHNSHSCYLLTYIYELNESTDRAKLILEGSLIGINHFEKTGLNQYIK